MLLTLITHRSRDEGTPSCPPRVVCFLRTGYKQMRVHRREQKVRPQRVDEQPKLVLEGQPRSDLLCQDVQADHPVPVCQ